MIEPPMNGGILRIPATQSATTSMVRAWLKAERAERSPPPCRRSGVEALAAAAHFENQWKSWENVRKTVETEDNVTMYDVWLLANNCGIYVLAYSF